MQVVSNTTGFPAGLTVATDVEARDHCVVVVKGTFDVERSGTLLPASTQLELVRADEHSGDPECSAVVRESEFALEKPFVDVVVDGYAINPAGVPVRELVVALDIEGRRKVAVVTGERRWVRSVAGFVASTPQPFTRIPLTFERAFGGIDDSDPGATVAELRNLVGVGFQPNRKAADIEGRSLPNIERPDDRVTAPRSRTAPIGFGCVARNALPRRKFVGTYDDAWRENMAPFLPADFDSRYFQCAPLDQQLPSIRGGERIRCVNMSSDSVVEYVLPNRAIPVAFRFADQKAVRRRAQIDTVILRPHERQMCLVWRTRVPLTKKIHQLHAVEVGETPAAPDGLRGFRDGKPHFRSLGEAIRWLQRRKASS